MSEAEQGITPRYTISVMRADRPIMSVNLVLGAEIEGGEIRFWFEPSKTKTVGVLALGDTIQLRRDA